MGNETNSLRSDALVSDPIYWAVWLQRPKRGQVKVKNKNKNKSNGNTNSPA